MRFRRQLQVRIQSEYGWNYFSVYDYLTHVEDKTEDAILASNTFSQVILFLLFVASLRRC